MWIIGCQRSRTTFFERVFRSDFNSSVFGEFSELTIHPETTVLKPLDEVKCHLSSCNARNNGVRPLFESGRIGEILEKIPNSRAIWLFRDCPQVVNSMIRKWGDQFFEISRRCETDEVGFWRLEQLGNHTKYCIDTIMRKHGLNGVWKNFKTDVQMDSLNKSVSVSITALNGDTESLGVSLIEAMACEVPVVATRHNGFVETVDDGTTGYLVEERDVADMARRISEIMQNRQLRDKMGQAARKRVVEHYDSKKQAERLRKMLDLEQK